ncbi:uridine kinase [Halobacillus alkaliphilus]|uniref:Uridine kinase n=1 Tax=Halobacillus alkaliphilus TaxID=396056 RepID=A0A1I2SGZ2_9BACI|nr:kinase [Halobacillus alkaliphilus]SFG49301.1 uridine kinase [Halobacillus alkaliphilus]
MVLDLCKILPSLRSGQLYIIGVDGLSRSGKTTFVNQLESELNKKRVDLCTFHMDNHIVKKNERYDTGFEDWYEYYQLQWEVEWLKEHLFEKVRCGCQLTLPFYDNEADERNYQTVDLPQEGVILIEGVFLQRKEWRPYFDHIIFLDCARNRRFAREDPFARKNMDKFRNRYWKAEDYYLRDVKPRISANCVLNT